MRGSPTSVLPRLRPIAGRIPIDRGMMCSNEPSNQITRLHDSFMALQRFQGPRACLPAGCEAVAIRLQSSAMMMNRSRMSARNLLAAFATLVSAGTLGAAAVAGQSTAQRLTPDEVKWPTSAGALAGTAGVSQTLVL